MPFNRLKTHVDQQLREEQAGFRSGRSCTEQILILRNIIEQSRKWQKAVYTSISWTLRRRLTVYIRTHYEKFCSSMAHHRMQQPFYGSLFGTTRVSRYQKKTLTHPPFWSSSNLYLHGSETWPVRKKNEVALQRSEMRMVRWMCNVNRLTATCRIYPAPA